MKKHPREQLEVIVSTSREQWNEVDIYGLMYALGVTLPPEKEEEVRQEFFRRFVPWRHMMVLMAEDVLCGELPELSEAHDVIRFYRKELYRLYPEIFLNAAKRLERHKYYYRAAPIIKKGGWEVPESLPNGSESITRLPAEFTRQTQSDMAGMSGHSE